MPNTLEIYGHAFPDLPRAKEPVETGLHHHQPHSLYALPRPQHQKWYSGDNTSRYDYLCTDSELQTFIEPIKHILKKTHIVQLFFNNHAKAQAVINPRKIEILLKQ